MSDELQKAAEMFLDAKKRWDVRTADLDDGIVMCIKGELLANAYLARRESAGQNVVSDELKAAVARLRTRAYPDNNDGWCEHDSDCALVADMYLSDLSRREAEEAERAKPADEQWLQTLDGFMMLGPFKELQHQCGLRYHCKLQGSPAYWTMNNQWRFPKDMLLTRGQVLDLLGALDVPTKGGA